PGLIASIEIIARSWGEPGRWLGDRRRRIMLAAALGGLISAALNRPFPIFYLLPALPALFVLSSRLLDESRPRWVKGAWALSVAAGIVPVAAWVVNAANAGIAPALDAQRRGGGRGGGRGRGEGGGPAW